ncbi:unnamed protein product [Rotaria magnacalcarata]|uniref:WWE domain-containing protein n=1 Tax=Rotaria magnacalcarata TaxID=392030 RepID=A0A816V276_9BILA|nr:unnamed protein product [Rotaria magnacalcarata]CAF3900560.1 unnamed protein product [Rotaria magnacalcarata]
MNEALVSDIFPVNTTNSVTWMWKSNNDPFDSKLPEKWSAYSAAISENIELAYRCHVSQVYIDQNYIIDLKKMMQVCTDDSHRQRPVKRCPLSDMDDDYIDWRRERFAFKLDQQVTDSVQTNTSVDNIKYYGSRFIADWLLKFADGSLKVKFDIIFPALINGIRTEGYLNGAPEKITKWLTDKLEEVRDEVQKKNEFKRIKYLSKCCAKLYTKNCFLFRLVNITLREDDRTKLDTLGPYCYLVYNYMGCYTHDFLSVRHRLLRHFRSAQPRSLVVYRGDSVPKQKLDEYQQAAGQCHKYFKWLSFVSTSYKRDVGEFFAINVLYIIELKGAVSNDQFADLCDNTFMPDEEEVLLRPGVRFRVKSVTFDSERSLQLIRIKIVPSYISYLR